jgi:uncharacterized protein (DUF488 family)
MATRVFSIGYEGRSVADLARELKAAGVDVVVDVRLTPWSRRPGFAKRQLAEVLAAAGIDYRHEPDLGNPKDNRAPFWNGEVEIGRQRFRKHLANGSSGAMRRLGDMARKTNAALLCVEHDERRCHRQVIVEALIESDPRMQVVRL